MLALALVLAAAPISYPEVLTRPVLAKVERFEWPKPDAFQKGWEKRDATGFQVYRGKVTGPDGLRKEGYFEVGKGWNGDQLFVVALEARTKSDPHSWKLGEGFDLKAGKWDLEEGSTFEVLERLPSQLSDADMVPWTYVSTLVGPAGPAKPKPVKFDRKGDEELDAVVRLARDEGKLAAWLDANKHDDALYARLMDYEPMGRCSMDTRPQATARLKAELAFARGDLATFLKRQVNIMGDQFSRVAWSSYGEASHGTEAERLLTTGVDFEKFMLGLLITRPGSVAALDPWRWARSVAEAGKIDAMREPVRQIAESPASDPMSRLRATMAYTYLGALKHKERSTAHYNAAVEETQKLKLHPVAVTWARGQVGEDE